MHKTGKTQTLFVIHERCLPLQNHTVEQFDSEMEGRSKFGLFFSL